MNPFVFKGGVELNPRMIGTIGTTYVPARTCPVPPLMLNEPVREYEPAGKEPGKVKLTFVELEPFTENDCEKFVIVLPEGSVSEMVKTPV